MTETEIEVPAPDDESYPDTLSCPEGQIHFGVEAQTFLAHWLGKLGCQPEGGALVFGEGCSLGIIHPETGETLTLVEIAKRARASKVRSVQ